MIWLNNDKFLCFDVKLIYDNYNLTNDFGIKSKYYKFTFLLFYFFGPKQEGELFIRSYFFLTVRSVSDNTLL